MRQYWYRRILIMILVFTISVVGSYYLIKGRQSDINQEVNADASVDMVIPGGMPIGIYMETEGVLILGTEKIRGIDGSAYEPAAHLVKEGDYIVAINEEVIKNKKSLIQSVGKLEQEEVILTVRRNNQIIDIKMKQ